jgi:hypothetical protein
MGVSNEAKNVIPLKFLDKIKNKNCFPRVNPIRGHTVCIPIVCKYFIFVVSMEMREKIQSHVAIRYLRYFHVVFFSVVIWVKRFNLAI